MISASRKADQPGIVENGKLADLHVLHVERRFRHQIDQMLAALQENQPQKFIQACAELGSLFQDHSSNIQDYLNLLQDYQNHKLPPLDLLDALLKAGLRLWDKVIEQQIPENEYAMAVLSKGLALFETVLGQKRVDSELAYSNIKEDAITQAEQCINHSLPFPMMKNDLKSKLDFIVQTSVDVLENTFLKGLESIRISHLGLFSRSLKSCNDDVVSFLKKNVEFFAAPFQDQKKFAEWASEYTSMKKLSEELLKALQCAVNENKMHQKEIFIARNNKPLLLQFQEAILGANGQNDGLIHGQEERMKSLLSKNAELCAVIKRHMHDRAIDLWYSDNDAVLASPTSSNQAKHQ